MKELTITCNAQITATVHAADGATEAVSAEKLAKAIKETLNVDDVIVSGLKIFEREVGNEDSSD